MAFTPDQMKMAATGSTVFLVVVLRRGIFVESVGDIGRIENVQF